MRIICTIGKYASLTFIFISSKYGWPEELCRSVLKWLMTQVRINSIALVWHWSPVPLCPYSLIRWHLTPYLTLIRLFLQCKRTCDTFKHQQLRLSTKLHAIIQLPGPIHISRLNGRFLTSQGQWRSNQLLSQFFMKNFQVFNGEVQLLLIHNRVKIPNPT